MKKIIRFILIFLFSFNLVQAAYLDQSSVVVGTGLCDGELNYLQKRDPMVAQAIKDFVSNQEVASIPRIAFGFSGGGYRSMICCAGFVDGAYSIGLNKTASYQAALSGGTWFLINYLTRNLSPQDFGVVLQKRVETSFFNAKTLDLPTILKKLEEKELSYGSLGPVDLWGALLAYRLMGDMGAKDALHFSFDRIRDLLYYTNKHPYPLFNSIISNVYPYVWLDISPFDCRMINLAASCPECYVPTFCFTSPYENGLNKKILPEESLSYFMGVLGSPYNASLGDIFYLIAYSSENETLKKIVAWMVKEFDLYNVRVLSSPIHNFMYHYLDQPLKNYKKTNFTDAGASAINIPFPALLKKERANDILIICDASTDAKSKGYPEMIEAGDYAKKHGLKFPPIKNPIKVKDDLVIFEDQSDPLVPTVVYFSNPDKTSTLKFDYTKEEFDKLYGTMKNLVIASRPVLIDVIKSKIKSLGNAAKARKIYLRLPRYVPTVYYQVPQKVEKNCFDQFFDDVADGFDDVVGDLADAFDNLFVN